MDIENVLGVFLRAEYSDYLENSENVLIKWVSHLFRLLTPGMPRKNGSETVSMMTNQQSIG